MIEELNDENEEKLARLLKLEDLQFAREDLLEFIQEIMPEYIVNWHHENICHHLMNAISTPKSRTMIWVPPQYGKSLIVSRMLPAFLLGINPKTRIILSSYSAELADSFNRDCQKIMESYEYQQIFPKTHIRSSKYPKLKKTSSYVETSQQGYLFTVGVGGSTTGRSADVFICDDPIKDMKDADSETQRLSKIDWFNSVAQTRCSKNAPIIVMHTRWHEQDLAGSILEKARTDPQASQYKVVCYPAIYDPDHEFLAADDPRTIKGESLWPEYKGDNIRMKQIESDVGSRVWAALFQQSPVISGGNIIKSEWWNFYTEKIDDDDFDEWVMSVDANFKEADTSDFVAIQVWARKDNKIYILDQRRGRWGIKNTIKNILEMLKIWDYVSYVLVEDKANGPAVIDLLKSKLPFFHEQKAKGSKESRVHAIESWIEGGHCYLPEKAIANFDVYAFIKEFSAFPNGANDDQVDAAVYAIMRLTRHLRTGIDKILAIDNLIGI